MHITASKTSSDRKQNLLLSIPPSFSSLQFFFSFRFLLFSTILFRFVAINIDRLTYKMKEMERKDERR